MRGLKALWLGVPGGQRYSPGTPETTNRQLGAGSAAIRNLEGAYQLEPVVETT
jgi:hypothetical protein